MRVKPRRKEERKCEEKKNVWKNKKEKFKKTYRKTEGVLGQAFGICKGSGELKGCAGSGYVR